MATRSSPKPMVTGRSPCSSAGKDNMSAGARRSRPSDILNPKTVDPVSTSSSSSASLPTSM